MGRAEDMAAHAGQQQATAEKATCEKKVCLSQILTEIDNADALARLDMFIQGTLPFIAYYEGIESQVAERLLEAVGKESPSRRVFYHKDVLSEVILSPLSVNDVLDPNEARPRIVRVTSGRLRGLVNESVFLFTGCRNKHKVLNTNKKPLMASDALLGVCLSRSSSPGVRNLTRVLDTPFILRSGDVVSTPGYHKHLCGVYLVPNVTLPDIPPPSREAALEAYERLEDTLFGDTDFLPECAHYGKSFLMSALLTAVSVEGLLFKSPVYAISAQQPQSGKSTLCQIIGHVATGRGFQKNTIPNTQRAKEAVEGLKVVYEAALGSDQLFFYLDNWPTGLPFGDAILAGGLTDTGSLVREYGQNSTLQFRVDRLVWFINGNSFRLAPNADMERRTLEVRVRGRADNTYRLGDSGSALQYVLNNRPALLRDCFTIMQSFLKLNPELPKHTPFASFEPWDRYIRGVFLWLNKPDPLLASTFVKHQYADTHGAPALAFFKNWWVVCGCKPSPVLLKELVAQVDDMAATDRAHLIDSIHTAFPNVVSPRKEIDERHLGNILRSYAGRTDCMYPFRLEVSSGPAARNGSKRWILSLAPGARPDDALPDGYTAVRRKEESNDTAY